MTRHDLHEVVQRLAKHHQEHTQMEQRLQIEHTKAVIEAVSGVARVMVAVMRALGAR